MVHRIRAAVVAVLLIAALGVPVHLHAPTVARAQSALPASIPILIYHNIDPTPGEYTVSTTQLESHLIWLRDNGYTSITPSELYAAWLGQIALPANPVIITADDGWASQYAFIDLINAYGFRATYFLPSYTPFSPDLIASLAATGEVCGHTTTHPRLSGLTYDQQVAEIADNKAWLEGIIGKPVTCFAYPFGDYNADSVAAVSNLGFTTAFKAWGGPVPITSGMAPMEIPRVNMDGTLPFDELIGRILGS